jgi:hypothetical protein
MTHPVSFFGLKNDIIETNMRRRWNMKSGVFKLFYVMPCLAALSVLLPLFVACTPRIETMIAPVNRPGPGVVSDSGPDIVVVMPVADYSQGNSPDAARRRQAKVMAALDQGMCRLGMKPAVTDDIVRYLVDKKVIQPIKDQKKPPIDFYSDESWSDATQEVVSGILATDLKAVNSEDAIPAGFPPEMVNEVANKFKASYLLRGRIIEYEIRDGYTLDPLRRGLLPFFFDSTSSAFFGVARSEGYDLFQDMAVGGAFGALLGSGANMPFNAPSTHSKIVGDNPRFATIETTKDGGYSLHSGLNAATWGAAGAGAAFLAKKGGAVPEAVVQMELALQRPDGEVLWYNRAEVKASLKSVFGDPRNRRLMDMAIESAVSMLMDDLNGDMPAIRARYQDMDKNKGPALTGAGAKDAGASISTKDGHSAGLPHFAPK